MEKLERYFFEKQNRLNKAIEKVKAKLDFFKTQSDERSKNWETMTEEQKEEHRAINNSLYWNEHHDLETRLENRLKDNFFDYQSWHYQQKGWAAY